MDATGFDEPGAATGGTQWVLIQKPVHQHAAGDRLDGFVDDPGAAETPAKQSDDGNGQLQAFNAGVMDVLKALQEDGRQSREEAKQAQEENKRFQEENKRFQEQTKQALDKADEAQANSMKFQEETKQALEENKRFQEEARRAQEKADKAQEENRLFQEKLAAATAALEQAAALASDTGDRRLAASAPATHAAGDEVVRMQAELYRVGRQLELAYKAAPQPGPEITTFRGEKFRAAWAMLLTIFPKTVALELDGYAVAAAQELARILDELLRPLLFDTEHWHEDVRGGGLHYGWDLFDDGFDGTQDGRRKVYANEDGKVVAFPAYGEHEYAALRQPMADAFRALQAGPLAGIVALAQKLAGQVYNLIPAPAAEIEAQELAAGAVQPKPDEFGGADYNTMHPSPGTVALVAEALDFVALHRANKTLDKLHIKSADLAFLEPALALVGDRQGPTHKAYDQWLFGKFVLAGPGFHKKVAATFPGLADVLHGDLKSWKRAKAKTRADYDNKMEKMKDAIRALLVVDDNRAMEAAVAKARAEFDVVEVKVRLASQTHDVVCVVRHEGILCELQFSFRSVLLMKSFSHAGYDLSRVKLDAFGGFREMLDMAFDLPRLGTNSAGGYETRKPEDINLIVSFYE